MLKKYTKRNSKKDYFKRRKKRKKEGNKAIFFFSFICTKREISHILDAKYTKKERKAFLMNLRKIYGKIKKKIKPKRAIAFLAVLAMIVGLMQPASVVKAMDIGNSVPVFPF